MGRTSWITRDRRKQKGPQGDPPAAHPVRLSGALTPAIVPYRIGRRSKVAPDARSIDRVQRPRLIVTDIGSPPFAKLILGESVGTIDPLRKGKNAQQCFQSGRPRAIGGGAGGSGGAGTSAPESDAATGTTLTTSSDIASTSTKRPSMRA